MTHDPYSNSEVMGAGYRFIKPDHPDAPPAGRRPYPPGAVIVLYPPDPKRKAKEPAFAVVESGLPGNCWAVARGHFKRSMIA